MGDTSPSWLRSSGLDASNGVDFLQQRIALFAKIVAILAISFLAIGSVVGLAVGVPAAVILAQQGTLADLIGFVTVATVWLIARRKQPLSLRALAVLDAVALLASCTAWAFFIEARIPTRSTARSRR